jgi:hypothetical protein
MTVFPYPQLDAEKQPLPLTGASGSPVSALAIK